MEDTFTIRAKVQDFTAWTNHYGEAHHHSFKHQAPAAVLFTRSMMLWHPVKQATGSAVLGWVKFAIQATDDDQTQVTAQLIGAEYHAIKRKVDAGDGWIGEEWVNVPFKSNEIAPELEQYYQAMMQAIRQKWPPATTTRLTGEDLARIEGRIAEFEREQKEMDALFAAIHRGIRTGSTQAPKPAANTAQTPEATVTAAQYLAALIDRTDKGAPQWWADLDSWWTQHCDAYTWVELAEKTGYSQQRLKQELTPKKDAKSSRRQ